MDYLNDWPAWVRLVCGVLCLISVYNLAKQRMKKNVIVDWTDKTFELWLALFAWSIAGVVIAVQGIAEHADASPRFYVYIVASVFTYRGVTRKGEWGGTHT